MSSNRIGLRYFREDDLEVFVEYRNDPIIARYQGWSLPYTFEDGVRFYESMRNVDISTTGSWLQLVIEDILNRSTVGDCAFKVVGQEAEVGISIRREYHQMGYAKETLRNLFGFLFKSRGLHRITAILDASNLGSKKLMESLDMRQEGHFVKNYYDQKIGKWVDELLYAILDEEFLS